MSYFKQGDQKCCVNFSFINDFNKSESIVELNEEESQKYVVFRGSRYRPKIDPKFNVETQKWLYI